MALEGHSNKVRCMIQISDGRLVSGGNDMNLKIWDIISGSCLTTPEGHTRPVLCYPIKRRSPCFWEC